MARKQSKNGKPAFVEDKSTVPRNPMLILQGLIRAASSHHLGRSRGVLSVRTVFCRLSLRLLARDNSVCVSYKTRT